MIHSRHDGEVNADRVGVFRIAGSGHEDVELILDARKEDITQPVNIVGNLKSFWMKKNHLYNLIKANFGKCKKTLYYFSSRNFYLVSFDKCKEFLLWRTFKIISKLFAVIKKTFENYRICTEFPLLLLQLKVTFKQGLEHWTVL